MTIGQTISSARIEQGLSIEELSEKTRIRPAVLTGIEADNFDACGGDTYARGHIRSIATTLGLDQAALLDEFASIVSRAGTTTVYVTHNLAEATRLGQQIVVLSRRPGRIRATFRIDRPIAGRTVAWTGDSNNVLASWVHAAQRFDFTINVASPPELAPNPTLVQWAKTNKAKLNITRDPYEAVRGADCVVTDCWVSMGDEDVDERLQALEPYLEIHLYVLNPCAEYWAEIVSPRRLSRLQERGKAAGHEVGNPLLAAWAGPTRAYFAALVEAFGDRAGEDAAAFQQIGRASCRERV